jgi:hypothetical protein
LRIAIRLMASCTALERFVGCEPERAQAGDGSETEEASDMDQAVTGVLANTPLVQTLGEV